jgi:ribosome-associated protein
MAEIDELKRLVATPRIRIPLAEFAMSFARSSGPGGQNVNKVNSKAVLRWSVLNSPSLPEQVRERFAVQYRSRITIGGELVIDSEEHRDQPSNIEACYDKVAAMIAAVAVPPKIRRATKPTKGSQRRRVEDKRKNSARKESRRFRPGD